MILLLFKSGNVNISYINNFNNDTIDYNSKSIRIYNNKNTVFSNDAA